MNEVEKLAKTTEIVSFSIAGSVVVYAALAGALAGKLVQPMALKPDDFSLAVVAAVVVFLLAVGESVGRIIMARGRGLEEYEKARMWFVGHVISFAIREAAALIGFALSLVEGDPFWCYAACGVVLVLLALAWPTRTAFERYMQGGLISE